MDKDELFEILKDNIELEIDSEGYNNPWSDATQKLTITLKFNGKILTQAEELI